MPPRPGVADEGDAFGREILAQKGSFMKTNTNAVSTSAVPPTASQKNGAPAVPRPPTATTAPAAGELVELQVWSVPAVNRALVICHVPEKNGADPMNLVAVQVRENSNFLKKMRLKARLVTANKFILEGACPRWRGKW